MKLTKKAAALLLAASLAVSVCATPVFAAPVTNNDHVQDSTLGEKIEENGINDPKQACTELKYTVTEGYTWSIPKDIEFKSNHGVAAENMSQADEVKVWNCRLKNDYRLEITIDGNDGQYGMGTDKEFVVKTAEGATLNYNVQKGADPEHLTDVDSGEVILSVPAGSDKNDETLTFTLETHENDTTLAEKAGVYIGYAIFTANVINTHA